MSKSIAFMLAALAAPLAADTPAPGFSSSVLPNGGPIYITVTLSNGQFVGVGKSSVRLFSPSGALIQVLHAFPWVAEYPVDVALDPSETFVVASIEGAFPAGGTYRVELTGGATQLGAGAVTWIAFEDADTVLFSSVGFPSSWSLERMNVQTLAWELVAEENSGFVGGPIAVDPSGNLYVFCDDFFGDSAADGTSFVVQRFLPSQFAVPGTLVLAEGTTVYQGSAFPADLSVSADGSTLFVAEEGRIVSVPLGKGAPAELVSIDPAEDLRGIQFLPGAPPAAFLAYQPPGGGDLVYQTQDANDDWQRKTLRPERPVLALSGPGTTGVGIVDLAITGGPPNGVATIFRGPIELFDPDETAIPVGGIPIFIGLDLATAVQVPVPIPLDPNGNAVRQLNNASGATSVWAVQAALRDSSGKLVCSTSAAFL
jgi:hypothetical protein